MAIPGRQRSVAILYVVQQRCLNQRKVRSAIPATAGLHVNILSVQKRANIPNLEH